MDIERVDVDIYTRFNSSKLVFGFSNENIFLIYCIGVFHLQFTAVRVNFSKCLLLWFGTDQNLESEFRRQKLKEASRICMCVCV